MTRSSSEPLSRSRSDYALLPVQVQPPWRRLPFLAWIAATGALPWNLGRAQVLLAPIAALLLPLLLAARLTGQLAAGRRCLVLVLHRRAGSATVLAITLLQLLAATAAAGYLTALFPWTTYVITAVVVHGCVVLALAVAVLIRRTWRGRVGPRGAPVHPARRPPGAIELSCAVAWPRRRGHARELWTRLAVLARDLDRPLYARAASPELAAAYAGYTDPPGTVSGQVVIWHAPAAVRDS